jgi:YhcH/YjgK/YiaL family protein
MIFDVLANADRYASVHPLFAECFAFLRQTDLVALPVGRQPLGSSGCTVIVNVAKLKTKEVARLEGHRVFIDIQYMVAGEELIGYVPRAHCAEISDDVANDFQELQGTAEFQTLRPGCFAIYFPEDAHQPSIGTGAHTGPVRKIVIKVPVQP